VVAIVSSSIFRRRSVQRPTEARYQLRDDEFNAIIDPKIRKQGLRTIRPNVTAANRHRL
jgi:hypothetical protein